MIDYEVLRDEILNDPLSLGYADKTDPEIADILNLLRPEMRIDVASVPGSTLIAAIVIGDYRTLSPVEQNYLLTLVTAAGFLADGNVQVDSPNVRGALESLFPPAKPSHDAILALLSRDGSRAEQLFGTGVVVRHEDVAIALRGR